MVMLIYIYIMDHCSGQKCTQAGVCCRPCNPSKWEADIWGWLKVRRSAMLHYTVNQCPHWACRQGNPGCWEMSILPAGYIPQSKVTSASTSTGSLGFIVCVKCCRMVDSVPRWQLSLSWPIQLDHLLIADRMIPPLGREHSHGKIQYIPGKQVLVRSWLENLFILLTMNVFFLLLTLSTKTKCFLWLHSSKSITYSVLS